MKETIKDNAVNAEILRLIAMNDAADSVSDPNAKIAMLKDMLKKTVFAKAAQKMDFALRFIPERIIKNGPATIVFWADGKKTVVKCGESEIPDDYAAFCAALGKKVYGSNSALKRVMMTALDNNKNDMDDKNGGSE